MGWFLCPCSSKFESYCREGLGAVKLQLLTSPWDRCHTTTIAHGAWGQDNTTSSSETADSASQSVSIAEQLNLSQGLAGTIMTSLLEYKVRDDARNGINFEENMRKRVETAQETIRARTKRYGAGLHVSAQRFMLGPEVLDDMEEGEELKQSKLLTQFQNRLQAFRSNRIKVSEIRALELSNEKLTVLQLKVMVNWYKRPGDLPVPSTRHLLIERLNSTCTRPDLDEPTAPQAVWAHWQMRTMRAKRLFCRQFSVVDDYR
jgi:hypothetical protein